MTLLEKLNEAPPVGVRAIAARHGKALSPDEIARKSGLSRSTVQRISSRTTWDGITIKAYCQFLHGCGFDSGNRKKMLKRLRDLKLNGLLGLRHMQLGPNAPLHKRGARANQIKFINKVITGK